MRRFKCFLSLSLLVASFNAFAGGGDEGGSPLISNEDWGTYGGYVAYAILVVLGLFASYKLVVWAVAPCRERRRRARAWLDAMNAPPKDDSPPEPTSTVG